MTHFRGLLGHVLEQEFGALAERVAEEEQAEEQEAEGLALPLDEREAWKRIANQRRLKAAQFAQDKEASWANLVWLVVASPILVLHWKLFKRAKWSLEIDTSKEQVGEVIKQFCIPSLNPAAAVIDRLLELLRSATHALRVVCFFHGPLEQWSEARVRTFQQLVLLACGQLWRKLVMPWRVYPWKLWPLVWGCDRERQLASAAELLAERDCCLDQPFTRKLRQLVTDPEQLLQAEMQEFLHVIFTRLVATSTFVERRFASYGAWVARRASACRLATLAAKHVTSCMKDFVASWKQRVQPEKGPDARSRPVWESSAAKGQRTTGLHLFTEEFRSKCAGQLQGAGALAAYLRDARAAWQLLSEAEKAAYTRRAKEKNAIAKATATARAEQEDRSGGPWRLARLHEEWPLSRDIIQDALSKKSFRELASAWKRSHCEAEAEAENVHEPGEAEVHLFATCPPGGCRGAMSQQQQQCCQQLRANLCTLSSEEGRCC